jgi:8-amino-7-oxononanoate synthase
MRTLIFTTALPPVNLQWTNFILERLASFADRRERLSGYGDMIAAAVRARGVDCPSVSHIVPWIIGSSADAIACAHRLRATGFYVLPVRPPTVPEGTSRIRFSLTAALEPAEVDALSAAIRA